MTPEQHQEFIEYALQIKWNRDAYSRAWIIEHLMDKVAELVNNSQAQSKQLHSCKYVKRIGESCTLNNNCKYPNCE